MDARRLNDWAHWANTLGVGPFFVKRHMSFSTFVYRGQVQPSPVISIALANSGDQQIKLIAQHNERPSIYRESLQSNTSDFHHVSTWLSPEDFDTARSKLLQDGVAIAQECTIASSGVRLICWATDNHPNGFFFEIADLDSPDHRNRINSIRRAAAQWDGTQAVIDVSQ